MKITFIITIDPIKEIDFLNIMVHSLNMQTVRDFDVVFYNQTLMEEATIFSSLKVRPAFPYRFFSIDEKFFLGDYPIWDLYNFHAFLLEEDLIGDYLMSLHMEQFFDVDYVEHALSVLSANDFDILMGNLTRSRIDLKFISPILETQSAAAFQAFLDKPAISEAPHWCFFNDNLLVKNKDQLKENVLNYIGFGFRKKIRPTRKGYTTMPWYWAEDLFFMKKSFAKKYNWFLSGHHLYFEDIHICQIRDVCALGEELKRTTIFPAYFNRRKIYHISHGRYYFQLLDDTFTSKMLKYETDDPVLKTLQKAIRKFKDGTFTLQEALDYSRRNPEKTGTQNLNYQYHLKYLHNGRAAEN